MKPAWHGVFPAATTQFRDDYTLELSATMAHLDSMIEAGVHGLIMLGTVGENCSLEYDEKLDVLRAAVDHVAGRCPVLSGVAECTTALACRFARDAERIGVDGLMVLPAMVYKSDPRETIAHFRAVARSTDLDVMVYNNPVSYAVDITPEMFAELADEPRLVAIKESSENVRRITDLKNICGDRYILFCGVDDLVLESVLLGASGWVSGLVNAFPVESCLFWDLVTAGRWERSAGGLSLVHCRSCIWILTSSWCSTSSSPSRNAGSGRKSSGPPRLPLIGEERERILAIIRRGIKTRPDRSTTTAGSRRSTTTHSSPLLSRPSS